MNEHITELLQKEVLYGSSSVTSNLKCIVGRWRHEYEECWDCDTYWEHDGINMHCATCMEPEEECKAYIIPPEVMYKFDLRGIENMRAGGARAWSAAQLLQAAEDMTKSYPVCILCGHSVWSHRNCICTAQIMDFSGPLTVIRSCICTESFK